MADVRRALRGRRPFELLVLVSTLLAVVEPRRRSPFDRLSDGEPSTLTRDELFASFLDVDRPETSVVLAVIAAMDPDEVLRARIERELATRRDALPAWLRDLHATEAYRTLDQTHVLRDGDNVITGARLPAGHELSIVVYIDHNLGTVAKDGFVVDQPVADLVTFMKAECDDPDMRWNDVDPADARARITEAIETGAMTFPPFESETWPACRPLVEWVTRLLPESGTGYERPEWEQHELDALADQFFTSSFGAGLDDEDHRGLLESMLWFGSDYGPGDPLHWSPVSVELLLADWIPRKIVADAAYLSKAPELLRAFIGFCHHERGLRPALTAETLAAVDRWEPEYQRTIRSARPQGPAALLAAVGLLGDDGPWPAPLDEPWDHRDVMVELLRDAVGGREALDALDTRPLPDEPFVWRTIPADVHERVAEVLALCDRCCDERLDVEYRTACRRVLARIAAGDPNVFRRRGRAETAAAALCWIVGKANDLFQPAGGGMRVKTLTEYFGIKHGSVSQRATTLLLAGEFVQGLYGDLVLGSPDYLVSSRRRQIIERRDRLLAIEDG